MGRRDGKGGVAWPEGRPERAELPGAQPDRFETMGRTGALPRQREPVTIKPREVPACAGMTIGCPTQQWKCCIQVVSHGQNGRDAAMAGLKPAPTCRSHLNRCCPQQYVPSGLRGWEGVKEGGQATVHPKSHGREHGRGRGPEHLGWEQERGRRLACPLTVVADVGANSSVLWARRRGPFLRCTPAEGG